MKLHYITVATKPHPVLNNIQNKVNQNRETIHILGQEEDRNIGWNANGNFGLKLKLVQDFLKRKDIQESDLILFTDAYDVIYYGDFQTIIERYHMFDKPIIFGAETTCSPDPNMKPYYDFTNTTFPFLNSGLYIGKVNYYMKNIYWKSKARCVLGPASFFFLFFSASFKTFRAASHEKSFNRRSIHFRIFLYTLYKNIFLYFYIKKKCILSPLRLF